jgi:hypothetical protein
MSCCYDLQQTLETELRTLRTAAEDLVAKFDEALAALSTRRTAVRRSVLVLELKLLGLARSLQAVGDVSDARERELTAQVAAAGDRRRKLAVVRRGCAGVVAVVACKLVCLCRRGDCMRCAPCAAPAHTQTPDESPLARLRWR